MIDVLTETPRCQPLGASHPFWLKDYLQAVRKLEQEEHIGVRILLFRRRLLVRVRPTDNNDLPALARERACESLERRGRVRRDEDEDVDRGRVLSHICMSSTIFGWAREVVSVRGEGGK